MTARVINGFDWLPTGLNQAQIGSYLSQDFWYATALPNSNWGANPNWPTSTVVGRFNFGYAVRFAQSIIDLDGAVVAPVGVIRPLGTGLISDAILSASMIRESTSDNTSPGGIAIGVWNAIANKPIVIISLSRFGLVTVWKSTGSNIYVSSILTSDMGSLDEDTWLNLQAKIHRDVSGGTVTVKLNNKIIISIVSENLGTLDFDSIFMGVVCGNGAFQSQNQRGVIDDFYALDTEGSLNNDFLGNLRVKSQATLSDGSHINSTIGGTAPAATHWQSVNVIHVDDSKLVYTPTTGDYDLYGMDPNQNSPLCRALQVRLVARQDDATQRTIKARLKSGSTLATGAIEFFLNQSYSHWCTIWETNPDTGVQFTGTEVNATEPGFIVAS